jgi:hypothetical protein
VNVTPLFVANAQWPKLIQPREGSLHNPSPSAQSTAVLSVSLGEPRHDVAGTQTSPDRLGVIAAVA